MAHKMDLALTVKEAKRINSRFDINQAKAEVIQEWTEAYGYKKVTMHRINYYTNEVYQLELDGEESDVWYAIFPNGDDVELEPVHWHEG